MHLSKTVLSQRQGVKGHPYIPEVNAIRGLCIYVILQRGKRLLSSLEYSTDYYDAYFRAIAIIVDTIGNGVERTLKASFDPKMPLK